MLGNNNDYKVKQFCGMSLYWSLGQDLLRTTLSLECSILKVEFVNLHIQ